MSTATLSISELKNLRQHLRDFEFAQVMNDLGWNNANGNQTLVMGEETFALTPIARLGGVQVIEVMSVQSPTTLPLEAMRRKVSDEVVKTIREHILVFVDAQRAQSHWYWVKRELSADNKRKVQPRTHTYIKGQPDDLFVGKLSGLFVDIGELNEKGDLPVLEAARRLSTALDSEGVVKKFYDDFKIVREDFASQIEGINNERDRAWYASVILNRLMFVYFLQGKRFLGRPDSRSIGDIQYLQTNMAISKKRGPNRYYSEFLHALFFDAFAVPEDKRTEETNDLVGQVPYLNGGLFLRHGIELKKEYTINIPDHAFDLILTLFKSYTWNLSDQDKHSGGLDPDVLGHIFEKYINQKGFGAYYTRPEITEYLCEQTIRKLVLNKIVALRPNEPHLHLSLNDAIASADANLVRSLLVDEDGLKQISLLDPACGSGAFLVAALKTMLDIYTAMMGHIDRFNDPILNSWRKALRGRHESANYNLKKKIITENLYGVDLMEEAAEIAKLRLFLSLVSSAITLDDLEPLPNIDFNILFGNSLIGLMKVDETEYSRLNPLFSNQNPYTELINKKNNLIDSYKYKKNRDGDNLLVIRRLIDDLRKEAQIPLNSMLLDSFYRLGIKFEQAVWNITEEKEGKSIKRALTLADVADLKPFHWGFEFAEVMERGGFDAIIANPPWDVWEAEEKEFARLYDPSIQKNKITDEEWELKKRSIWSMPGVLETWLNYVSSFKHTSAFYKKSIQYKNNISIVKNRDVSGKVNLYRLFTELSFHLMRDKGIAGIVIPGGIYTDIGTSGLRRLLINSTEITGIFGFENRKGIFEDVHKSDKFVVLSFIKAKSTESFPATFMQTDVKELKNFPSNGIIFTKEFLESISPDTLSIPEIYNEIDKQIIEKISKFPRIDDISEAWDIRFSQEFNMTSNKDLFHAIEISGDLPLIKGANIHFYTDKFASIDLFVDESIGRRKIIGKRGIDDGAALSYQEYRLVHRRISRNTDTRTLISTVLPPGRFCGDTAQVVRNFIGREQTLYVCGLFNSFLLDYELRKIVTKHCDAHFMYTLRVPRLDSSDRNFRLIINAVAKLICIAPEFDDLAKAVGMKGYGDGVTNEMERRALRAEINGRTAHLYGLTESEFMHVLSTFTSKDAKKSKGLEVEKASALQAFRDLAPPIADPKLVNLVIGGEGQYVEFKETFAWDVRQAKAGDNIKAEVYKTLAAFSNSTGGTLLIGVSDAGRGVGLNHDLQLRPKAERSPDKFELYLRSQLRSGLTPDVGGQVSISFPALDGKMICQVDVKSATADIFTQDGTLYVRRGNESRSLKGAELAAHIRERAAQSRT